MAEAARCLRVEDDFVEVRIFAGETLAVLFVAGGCLSGAGGSAVAGSGGAGSVLTIEVV